MIQIENYHCWMEHIFRFHLITYISNAFSSLINMSFNDSLEYISRYDKRFFYSSDKSVIIRKCCSSNPSVIGPICTMSWSRHSSFQGSVSVNVVEEYLPILPNWQEVTQSKNFNQSLSSLNKEREINTFHESISAIWNVRNLVQDSNSYRWVHFLER